MSPDLEILEPVHFLLFLVSIGPREPISAECKIFYPVAFFLGGGRFWKVRYLDMGPSKTPPPPKKKKGPKTAYVWNRFFFFGRPLWTLIFRKIAKKH